MVASYQSTNESVLQNDATIKMYLKVSKNILYFVNQKDESTPVQTLGRTSGVCIVYSVFVSECWSAGVPGINQVAGLIGATRPHISPQSLQ